MGRRRTNIPRHSPFPCLDMVFRGWGSVVEGVQSETVRLQPSLALRDAEEIWSPAGTVSLDPWASILEMKMRVDGTSWLAWQVLALPPESRDTARTNGRLSTLGVWGTRGNVVVAGVMMPQARPRCAELDDLQPTPAVNAIAEIELAAERHEGGPGCICAVLARPAICIPVFQELIQPRDHHSCPQTLGWKLDFRGSSFEQVRPYAAMRKLSALESTES
ncbi:hypothetical protein N658DRAFT_326840 [Parathielavia hyrcaniae]|uniref:Uncharacterized protein n=1 Tax=Parathielavia hyrcaniae TaxID=113614 RepID=A0AAN6Q3D9_9PEZI|nr:hypothetical protein N658DRAFT_326840 [Parathielavia hyrcaniae]